MHPIRFDALVQALGTTATRRHAMAVLLGLALLETGLGTAAAKPEPQYNGTSHGKSRRHNTRRGKRKGHVRAEAKTKPGNHCTEPFGLDLNEFFGISTQIVTHFCPEVGAGERWSTSGLWFVNASFAIAPEGFVPTGTTPLQDFQAKFTALKFVIDPGTRQERTVVFPNDGNLFAGAGGVFPGTPAEWVVVAPVTLGTVQPLSVGDHVVDIYWVFSAMHCDGVGADPTPGVNCFPAGETKYPVIDGLAFEVTPGHHS